MSAIGGDFENKKSPQKKEFQEKTYYLSKIVENGGCIHCLNNSCRNRSNHGIEFPEKLTCFVKNPRFIKEVATSIESASSNGILNFDDIPFNVTTCTFIHTGNCKNCNEGRYKTFDMNGGEIGVCFPAFDETKTKIIVGVHMDIKIIMRGKHYEVSALPILKKTRKEQEQREQKQQKEEKEVKQELKQQKRDAEESAESFDTKSENAEDTFDFSNVLKIYENSKQKKHGNFQYGLPITRNSSSESIVSYMTQELSLASMDEFPSLGNTPCPSPLVVLENSPTKKNFADIIKYTGNEQKERKMLSLETNFSSRNTTPRFTPISDDKREITVSPLPERVFTPISCDDAESQNIILKQRLEVLRKENSKLKEEIQVLEMTNKRNIYVIENELKIGEFLKNRNLLNNTVIEQFFNTHYADYIVID